MTQCTKPKSLSDRLVAQAIESGVLVAGYDVCGIAATAEEALALTARHRPRLAVIDVDLGSGRDGVALARKMLSLGPVGIMFVTGFPDKARTVDVGHAWMPKPYRVLDLINALDVVKAMRERHPITVPIPSELP
jgi:DNA-binding response OmpR family regulator